MEVKREMPVRERNRGMVGEDGISSVASTAQGM
jgi:hypothetical protein